MLKVGQLLKLNDNKLYLVLNVLSCHNINYIFLINYDNKKKVILAQQNIIDDKISLDIIKDKHEIDYVLSTIALNS